MFAAFLVLLTTIPRFCTPVLDTETSSTNGETALPSQDTADDQESMQRTPLMMRKSWREFTPEDRRQIEEEAFILEETLCYEEQPSADFCQVQGVEIRTISDSKVKARIVLEYHRWDWESSDKRIWTVTKEFERSDYGWKVAGE